MAVQEIELFTGHGIAEETQTPTKKKPGNGFPGRRHNRSEEEDPSKRGHCFYLIRFSLTGDLRMTNDPFSDSLRSDQPT